MENNNLKNYTIPISIIVAGAIIGVSLYIALSGERSGVAAVQGEIPQGQTGDIEKIRPVSSDDHIRGDINAPVVIVEYSDTECPFCKRFHETMRQVMDENAGGGKVAWVYRHFPLDGLHKRADKEAEALECASEQGGPSSPLGTRNDLFWKYADRLFEITPSNDGLDPSELPKIAAYIGIDVQKFNTCLSSGTYASHVEEDTQNAMATGGKGTPWSIVIGKNGKMYPLNGAQPIEAVRQLIEAARQGK